MATEQITDLILIFFGLYAAIRFRYNGKSAVKTRIKLANLLSFGKTNKEIKKSDIMFSQLMYLIGGIIFIFIGLIKLLSR